ncbi:MAG: GIY-YIG nuclease family protein [Gemmatimonadales bacterium]
MRIVYFVQDTAGGEIKVGVARKRQLRKRIGKLQLGNPSELKLLGVIPARNAGELQRELHTSFSDAHIRGEWFRSTPDLLAYIRQRAVMP